eukprot:GHUV01004810.1.p1 GENE.GHUV01004810.1~~GHUV01004810.1.p1  ORF type:complete len:207 (+),score=57.03 GHUV01004810.1:78-698(+)
MAFAQTMRMRTPGTTSARGAFSTGKAPRAVACRASTQQHNSPSILQQAAAVATAGFLALSSPALAEEGKLLCDDSCLSNLESVEMVTTPSGLQYKDITVGRGPAPITGYQVVVNYVAQTPKGFVFENSLEKQPFDIRVGAGQVIPGLDEGLMSMKVGGVRRLYIPGGLSFPKPLKAAPGRPSVPANSPVVFDVQLLYIPGLDMDEE